MVARSYARHVTLDSASSTIVGDRRSRGKSNFFAGLEFKLGTAQLLVSWALISGIMFAVFIFGFNAGKKEAREEALLERSTSDIRLPVIGAQPPSATPKKYSSIAQNDTASIAARDAVPGSSADQQRQGVVADYPTPVVGYSSKSATAATAEVVNSGSVSRSVSQQPIPSGQVGNRSGSLKAAGWYIQVGSTRDLKQADSLKAKGSDSGVVVSIEQASVRGVSFYQLLAGPYETKEKASSEMERLKTQGTFPGRLFVKELK